MDRSQVEVGGDRLRSVRECGIVLLQAQRGHNLLRNHGVINPANFIPNRLVVLLGRALDILEA